MTVKQVEFDLRSFHLDRILYVVNELLLWPVGLALTIETDENGNYRRLYVTEWACSDGHVETIVGADGDDVLLETFDRWLGERIAKMPDVEQEYAMHRLRAINFPWGHAPWKVPTPPGGVDPS